MSEEYFVLFERKLECIVRLIYFYIIVGMLNTWELQIDVEYILTGNA